MAIGKWDAPIAARIIVERPDLVEDIIEALCRPRLPGPALVVLYGLAGYGKTTLAQQLRQHPEVQAWFEGILWLTLGQNVVESQLAARINDLSFKLSDRRPGLIDPGQAGRHLGRLLVRRNFLLIIGKYSEVL